MSFLVREDELVVDSFYAKRQGEDESLLVNLAIVVSISPTVEVGVGTPESASNPCLLGSFRGLGPLP